MINKIFTKTSSIKVLSKEKDGYLVCNIENETDKWVIPFNVFEKTYKEVEYDKEKKTSQEK